MSLLYSTNFVSCGKFFSGGDCSLKFKMLMNNIMNTAALAEKFNAVRSE